MNGEKEQGERKAVSNGTIAVGALLGLGVLALAVRAVAGAKQSEANATLLAENNRRLEKLVEGEPKVAALSPEEERNKQVAMGLVQRKKLEDEKKRTQQAVDRAVKAERAATEKREAKKAKKKAPPMDPAGDELAMTVAQLVPALVKTAIATGAGEAETVGDAPPTEAR